MRCWEELQREDDHAGPYCRRSFLRLEPAACQARSKRRAGSAHEFLQPGKLLEDSDPSTPLFPCNPRPSRPLSLAISLFDLRRRSHSEPTAERRPARQRPSGAQRRLRLAWASRSAGAAASTGLRVPHRGLVPERRRVRCPRVSCLPPPVRRSRTTQRPAPLPVHRHHCSTAVASKIYRILGCTGKWEFQSSKMSESDDIQRGLETGSDEAVGPNQAQDGKKQTNPRSEIWKHYPRLPDDRNKAKCIYCCRVLACDSQKKVTKSWKMSRNSSKQNESEVDRMEHNKHIISELLLGKEGSFSTGVTKGDQGAQNNGKEGQGCKDSFPFFVEVISGLSKSDKERLKHALHEVVTFLNDDVDEILGHILAISKFGSEKLLPSHGSGSFGDGIAPPCAKRQKPVMVSLPDAYEKEHGHLSSDIFEQVTRDIQAIEESGETRQEAVKKFSTGLLGKLGKMAQGVDDLLDTVASKCRPMTTAEKLELGKRIRKLPEKALDRMVEIVKMRGPESQSSDKVSINLGELDDATLWRLYYHVESVLQENKI